MDWDSQGIQAEILKYFWVEQRYGRISSRSTDIQTRNPRGLQAEIMNNFQAGIVEDFEEICYKILSRNRIELQAGILKFCRKCS